VLSRAQTIARLVDNGNYRPATLLNMVYALHYTGQQHKALRQARMIPLQQLNDLHKSSYYEVMGRIQLALGDLQAARRNLQLALKYHANTNAAEILLMLPAVEAH
jgi:tetratricopeptide (TPR) repeat protein